MGNRGYHRSEPLTLTAIAAAAKGAPWISARLDTFTDVRELQRRLKAQGVELAQEADEGTTGPASFVAVDPDGNPILVDQHV